MSLSLPGQPQLPIVDHHGTSEAGNCYLLTAILGFDTEKKRIKKLEMRDFSKGSFDGNNR